MKIGVIGTGNVGGTLGKRLADLGNQVFFGFRNPNTPAAQTLMDAGGPSAVATTPKGAAEAGDVVILATPWDATQAAIESAGGLAGKIVVDTTNPLLPGLTGLSIGTNTSAGEQVAEWARGARVVKAFNTVGYGIMADPAFPQGKPSMFYCGDDAQAKGIVAGLVAGLGFDPLDAGPLTQCRVLEAFAMLWISLAVKYGYTPDFAFQMIRRNAQ
jgi:predicted dinucleotide-binding enzyme